MTQSLPPALCPALSAFTASQQQGDLQPGHQEFTPGFFLHSDPKLGLSGAYSSSPGRLLDLEVQTTGPGDWAALHQALPLPDLTSLSYIGFLCRITAPEIHMLRVCLRSGLEGGGFTDQFFDKHILTADRPFSHMDALYLDACPELPVTAPWRELVLFLPCQPFQISLQHLHAFAF